MKKQKRLTKTKADGDCYKVAAQILLYNQHGFKFNGEPKLVHAVCTGRGPIKGKRFGHAWVEDDVLAYDYSNGCKVICLKSVYHAAAKVNYKPSKFRSYTKEEAIQRMAETGHYFFNDIKTKN